MIPSHLLYVGCHHRDVMHLSRCYLCGLPLGQTRRPWLDRLTCVRWNGPHFETIANTYRRGTEFRSKLRVYLAGADDPEDDWYTFGLHTACYDILYAALQTSLLEGMLASACELFYLTPYEKFFEAGDAYQRVEFDDQDIIHHPTSRIDYRMEEHEYLFADPNAVEWNDIGANQSVKANKQVIDIFLRQKSDDLLTLPPELLEIILEHLPTQDIRNLRAVSPAAALLRLSAKFWSDRLVQDMPFIKFIKGKEKSNTPAETQYKHLRHLLRHGIGQTVDSLRNLQRIDKQAQQICDILQLRELMVPSKASTGINCVLGPHGCTSVDVPLLELPLYFSSLVIGRTHYLSGIRIGSATDSRRYGFHYQGPLHVLPNYSSNGKAKMSFCRADGGYVKIGYTTSHNEEASIGSMSGISVSQNETIVERGSIMRLEFDHFRITSIRIGQPGHLEPLALWQPLPPPMGRISPLTPSEYMISNNDAREVCYFGGENGCRLNKLTQINAFIISDHHGFTGLEFIYTDGTQLQWGSCFGTRQCATVDGPGGERIIAMGAVSNTDGIVSMVLQTNGNRELDFQSTRLREPRAHPNGGDGPITGLYGHFQPLSRGFSGAKTLHKIGYLWEPAQTAQVPQYVSKKSYSIQKFGCAREQWACSTTAQANWDSLISFAPIDHIRTMTGKFDKHDRLTGLFITYADAKFDTILGNFVPTSSSINTFQEFQTEKLGPDEHIQHASCHYAMKCRQTKRKIVKAFRFTTNHRVIEFGDIVDTLEDSFELETDRNRILPKGIYWIYNVAFDQFFCNL